MVLTIVDDGVPDLPGHIVWIAIDTAVDIIAQTRRAGRSLLRRQSPLGTIDLQSYPRS